MLGWGYPFAITSKLGHPTLFIVISSLYFIVSSLHINLFKYIAKVFQFSKAKHWSDLYWLHFSIKGNMYRIEWELIFYQLSVQKSRKPDYAGPSLIRINQSLVNSIWIYLQMVSRRVLHILLCGIFKYSNDIIDYPQAQLYSKITCSNWICWNGWNGWNGY